MNSLIYFGIILVNYLLFLNGQYLKFAPGVYRANYCKEPDEIDLFNRTFQLEMQLMLMDENNLPYPVLDLDFKDGRVHEFASRNCLDRTISDQLNDMATCPWTKAQYYDRKFRFPPSRVMAKCICERPPRERENMKYAENFKSTCLPFTIIQSALQKTGNCINGIYEWVPIFEKVPISCTPFQET